MLLEGLADGVACTQQPIDAVDIIGYYGDTIGPPLTRRNITQPRSERWTNCRRLKDTSDVDH